jgi:hypothetical protein
MSRRRQDARAFQVLYCILGRPLVGRAVEVVINFAEIDRVREAGEIHRPPPSRATSRRLVAANWRLLVFTLAYFPMTD